MWSSPVHFIKRSKLEGNTVLHSFQRARGGIIILTPTFYVPRGHAQASSEQHCLQEGKVEAAQTPTMGSGCWSCGSGCGWRQSWCRTRKHAPDYQEPAIGKTLLCFLSHHSFKMCLGRILISKLLTFLTTLRELSHRTQTVLGIGVSGEDAHQAGPLPHGAWCRGLSAYFPSVLCRRGHPHQNISVSESLGR